MRTVAGLRRRGEREADRALGEDRKGARGVPQWRRAGSRGRNFRKTLMGTTGRPSTYSQL